MEVGSTKDTGDTKKDLQDTKCFEKAHDISQEKEKTIDCSNSNNKMNQDRTTSKLKMLSKYINF